MQIGIFGGTFNPIHHGHLLIAEFAREQFHLDKVIFVTSGTPPHRTGDLLHHQFRHELVQAAVSTNQFFEASDIEIKREGPSYTVDTLREMKELHGEKSKLYLIIGGDNVTQLTNWHNADEIFETATILVAPRLVYESDQQTPYVMQLKNRAHEVNAVDNRMKLEVIDFPGVAISSSLVRERIGEGKSVRYMVPREVNEILVSKGYYSPGVRK